MPPHVIPNDDIHIVRQPTYKIKLEDINRKRQYDFHINSGGLLPVAKKSNTRTNDIEYN